MKTQNRIKAIIQELKSENKPVTVDTVIEKSLFSKGGTLAGHENEVIAVFEEITDRLHAKGREYERTCTGSFIRGLAGGIMVNEYFNLN